MGGCPDNAEIHSTGVQQDDHYLGDIAIGYDIMVAEAEAAVVPTTA